MEIQGWDWGPKLLDCGPWKPIFLEFYEAQIADVSIKTRLDAGNKHAEIGITFEVDGPATTAKVEVESDGAVIASRVMEVRGEASTAATAFTIENPKLWGPFTFGGQPLYKAKVTLLSGEEGPGPALDAVEKKFGIRKVELIQRPFKDREGKSFFFQVNGVPIFAGGSCWIPTDSFQPRITPKRYRDWVSLVRESNQVMIRVWGGGVYEHEAFYEACDELGIMVWQDFMFACGVYPAYAEFQETAREEVEQNVKKLRHHPSIAVWCGNNEDYVIPLLTGEEYDAGERDPKKILQSPFPGRLLYERLFPEICKHLTPEIPYWPGSPYGGEFVNSVTEGDVHQWHVWHLEKFPYQQYPQLTGRFVSEFGMQAAPCADTMREFFPPSDSHKVKNSTDTKH
jgi:beta-mannosidase